MQLDNGKHEMQFNRIPAQNDKVQSATVSSIGVNLYTFGVPLGPPPMLSLAPAMVLSAPAIIEGCQSMKWSGSNRWINNPVQSLELTDFTGFVT